MNKLLQIAKRVYFQESGNIDYNKVKKEYKLQDSELNHLSSLIRNLNNK